ncbi:MAG: hypothetical protein QOH66_2697 [Actinomycetota bacterium]|jgi:hypothetical protein|nr:hypothetical protein [Actinomycetota bacterium]MEA2589770.1 hypothetical protein [Actinomycetota bacterium]
MVQAMSRGPYASRVGGAASDPLHKDVYLTAVTVIPVLWLTADLAARDVIWAVLHDDARLGGWLRGKLHRVPTGQPSAMLLGRAFGLLAQFWVAPRASSGVPSMAEIRAR